MYMGSGRIWVMKPDGSGGHPVGGVGGEIHWVS
jgi:hypothetical protein